MAASPHAYGPVDRLLRQVETRVEAKQQIGDIARGLLGTALIFGGIVLFMVMMLVGAILFATVMSAFQR